MAVAKANKRNYPYRTVTQEKIDAILKDISEGSPKKIAAEANGISDARFHELIAQGIVDLNEEIFDSLPAKLAVSLRQIEQEEIKWCRNAIRNDADGHKGAEWTLKHAYWRHFSGNAPLMELAKDIEKFKAEHLKGVQINGQEVDSESN